MVGTPEKPRSKCTAWVGNSSKNLVNLKVRYFAIFREAVGTDSEAVSSSADTARELFSELSLKNPGLKNYQAALVAINNEMADWDSPLADGDEVLFFPPVAGG